MAKKPVGIGVSQNVLSVGQDGSKKSSDSKIRRTGMLSGVWIERVERLRSTGKAIFTSADLARICSVAERQAIKVLAKETKTLVSAAGGFSFSDR